MIPSIVASEVLVALRDFLKTGYGPSTPELAGVVDDFLADPDNLAKGPYLSLSLPFERAPEGGEPFPRIPLGFTPYKHQRAAFERLSPDTGRSTVIATGTGSGKTECFLYPVLEYCRRQAGRKGIKAVVVYPMNALASDQARRIAQIVRGTPALRGKVTAGLFIGQTAKSLHERMGPDNVITDRAAMRDRPPDILLTNYKMLDYLMIRPRDRRLWCHNEPDTLRYLVVDELHTFDGARGTDLACLIRRLRMRLGAPAEKLVCVGTSATLGGDPREYVSRIFDQRFDQGSIVGESRQTIDDFLGDALIRRHLLASSESAAVVDHRRYDTTEAYLRAQHELFLGEPIDGTFHSADWRVGLGEKLREHIVFVNLLRALDGRPTALPELAKRLRGSLPVANDSEALGVLNGLCALISAARVRVRPGGEGGRGSDANDDQLQPFLHVGVHLWVRELRRMVCSVGSERGLDRDPSPFRLRHSDDLKADEAFVHLPLVQCRECRATGWLTKPSMAGGGSTKVLSARTQDGLGEIYGAFFGRDLDTAFLFPGLAPAAGMAGAATKGMQSLLCGSCGALTSAGSGDGGRSGDSGRSSGGEPACRSCGNRSLVHVFRPVSVTSGGSASGGASGSTKSRLSTDCPYCNARNAMVIVGARASSLLSAALNQTVSSRHNADAKVIAFSDNVQDAAHRAGYMSARTWRTNMRAAIAQTVADSDADHLSLAELMEQVVARWRNRWTAARDQVPQPDQLPQPDLARFVGEFIAPDRRWLNEFRELESTGRLPADSKLPGLVAKRMRWDTIAEFGQRSAIGRTLENTRTAAVGVHGATLAQACELAQRRLREEVEGLRDAPDRVARALVLGVVRRMKDRGAILTDLVSRYLARGGDTYVLRNDLALPDYGTHRSAVPVFPGERAQASKPGIEAVFGPGGRDGAGRSSWYRKWTQKVLDHEGLAMAARDSDVALRIVFRAMEDAGLARKVNTDQGRHAWGLALDRLYVTAQVAEVPVRIATGPDSSAGSEAATSSTTPPVGRPLIVPRQEAELWQGVPSLDLAVSGAYGRHRTCSPTWFGGLYRKMDVRRIVAAEHTALLSREERERVQDRFTANGYRPWDPNVLSATPTLELGIDVGDLSTVMLCSVPPAPANYVQRAGRAGRRDGNAFSLAVAAGRPHDLYFYAEPSDMLAGKVEPPGVFLNARAVLERQMIAYCLDSWVAAGVDEDAVPRKMRAVLDNVERERLSRFPYTFFDFVSVRAGVLADSFLAAFEHDLSDANKHELAAFLLGDDVFLPGDEVAEAQPSPRRQPLARRLLDRFAEVAKERNSVRKEIDALRRQAEAMRRGPQDDSVRAEIDQALRERAGLQGVLRKINGRETYNFLTDEGLVPNYAFPEKGVMLRSVIYRKRKGAKQAGEVADAEFDHEVFEYERPAPAALAEFAPDSSFYAGARRVRIDRVDLETSKLEEWRLCPSCVYCERIDGGDRHAECPRCGDPMWVDGGQRREMLPLRMVHATTSDKESRIGDEKDVREPSFYTRHLVADFDPEATRTAFVAASAPFGFEYIPSATFREMNFGPRPGQGQPTRVAGVSLPRSGFRVCRRCGKVQPGPGEKAVHTRTCPTTRRSRKNRPGDDDVAECIYLYREFESEAIRMLVPGVGGSTAELYMRSFVAALELGLRRKFGGEIDHLRAMECEYPIAGADASSTGRTRRYLLLYDTVPGGTGYLKDRMTDPEKLRSIFQAARTALRECACAADPEKDGCYRCVFAYRRSREMPNTSRKVAERLMATTLERWPELEEVERLASVPGNVLAESELEERFVEALRQRQRGAHGTTDGPGPADAPTVRIRQDQVGGKPRYVLSVGDHTYFVEPQVSFGMGDGVDLPSRPDFVLQPARSPGQGVSLAPGRGTYPDAPAVAVFLDGFEYHRNKTGDDSAKRMSLVRAGFLVWSLTWDDLEGAFGGTPDAPDLLGDTATPVQKALDAKWGTQELRSRLRAPSFDLLLHYLADPAPVRWRRAVFGELLGLFDPDQMRDSAFRVRFVHAARDALPSQVLEYVSNLPSTHVPGGFGPWDSGAAGAEPTVASQVVALFAVLRLGALEDLDPAGLLTAVYLDDAEASADPGRPDSEYRRAWNGVLRLFNLVQFLPQGWWTTRSGVAGGLYPEFAPLDARSPSPEPWPDEWADAARYTAPQLRPALRELASILATAPAKQTGQGGLAHIPSPEPGFELADETGQVVAEAELAWPSRRTAVLLPEQDVHKMHFERAGWRVFTADAEGLGGTLVESLVQVLAAAPPVADVDSPDDRNSPEDGGPRR